MFGRAGARGQGHALRPSGCGSRREQALSARRELRDDVPGPYDVVAIGDVRFFVIDRDGRMGIRVRDLRSPKRAAFKGLQYFPINPSYRVVAQFVPHAQAHQDQGAERAGRHDRPWPARAGCASAWATRICPWTRSSRRTTTSACS